MRIIDRKGENRGGVWSSRRCGDGGNPLRAAWTFYSLLLSPMLKLGGFSPMPINKQTKGLI